MKFAIILCGGTGTRMGNTIDIPKQFVKVGDKRIFEHSLLKFDLHQEIDQIIICLEDTYKPLVLDCIENYRVQTPVLIVEPGKTRQGSIYNGLKKIKDISYHKDDWVIIHDGARPNIEDHHITDCFRVGAINDGAIASIDVFDTIYLSDDSNLIKDIPKRDSLRAGQTPECFRLKKYIEIHETVGESQIDQVTGGAQFAAINGMKIGFSKGSISNYKITTIEDLEKYKKEYAERR